MAAKKVKHELASIRGDVRELTEAVWALRDHLTTEQAVAAAERQTRGTPSPDGKAADADGLEAADAGDPGHVSLSGRFLEPPAPGVEGEGRSCRWTLDALPVATAIESVIEPQAQVLAAIGHKQRLGILIHLLSHPSTASELVAARSLGTTGAAYHHVNVLQAAGLVEQRQRGVFAIVPRRIPTLLTILASLSDDVEVQSATVVAGPPDAAPAHAVEEAGEESGKKGKRKGG